MTVDTISIHATEIRDRPPRSWRQIAYGILFFFVFNLGCLAINASQFLFILPLRLIPLVSAKSLYDAGIRFSEGAFGSLLSKCLSLLTGSIEWIECHVLVLMCQWFAPSRLVITLERDGPGAFSMEEIGEMVIGGSDGRVLGLKLPLKSVLIANHQVCTCPSNSLLSCPPYHFLGLCRLVVCVVLDLLHGHPQRCLHRSQERSPVDPCRRLGKPLLFPPYVFSSLSI